MLSNDQDYNSFEVSLSNFSLGKRCFILKIKKISNISIPFFTNFLKDSHFNIVVKVRLLENH